MSEEMNHKYYEDLISGYIDGELTPQQQKALEKHLEECSLCSEELARLRKLDNLVAAHSQLGGEDYWEKSARAINERIEAGAAKVTDLKAERAKRGGGLFWKISTVAASALILGYIGFHQSDIMRDRVDVPLEVKQKQTPPSPVEDTESGVAYKKDRSENALQEAEVSSDVTLESAEERSEIKPQAVAESEPMPVLSPSVEAEHDKAHSDRLSAPSEVQESIDDLSKGVAGSSAYRAESVDQQKPREIVATSTAQVGPDKKLRDDVAFQEAPGIGEPVRITNFEEHSISVNSVGLYGADETEELAATELQYWRAQRDSLLSRGLDSDRRLSTSATGESKAKSAVGPKIDLEALVAPRSTPDEPDEVGLLEAWYNICLFTTDLTESAEGISFLRQVASDSASENSNQAAEYLRKLGRE